MKWENGPSTFLFWVASWDSAGELTLVVQIRESQSADQLGWTQGSELVHPQIYIICKHLGCMTRPVLLIQRCRIYMTQGNYAMTMSLNDNPVLMVSQKLETPNQPNNSLQYLQ